MPTALTLVSTETGEETGPPDGPDPRAVDIWVVSMSTPIPTLVDGAPS